MAKRTYLEPARRRCGIPSIINLLHTTKNSRRTARCIVLLWLSSGRCRCLTESSRRLRAKQTAKSGSCLLGRSSAPKKPSTLLLLRLRLGSKQSSGAGLSRILVVIPEEAPTCSWSRRSAKQAPSWLVLLSRSSTKESAWRLLLLLLLTKQPSRRLLLLLLWLRVPKDTSAHGRLLLLAKYICSPSSLLTWLGR